MFGDVADGTVRDRSYKPSTDGPNNADDGLMTSSANDRDPSADMAQAACSVLAVLEDRRLLFGERHLEDEQHTLKSSFEIRSELTRVKQLGRAGNRVDTVIDAVRSACRDFADSAGPDARNFHPNSRLGVQAYSRALEDLPKEWVDRSGVSQTNSTCSCRQNWRNSAPNNPTNDLDK